MVKDALVGASCYINTDTTEKILAIKMSKSRTASRRKNLKGKTNETLPVTKEVAITDIAKYLVKQPEIVEDSSASEVSLPCPNDAALPCSTFNDSVCQISDCFILGDKDVCKSSRSSTCYISSVDIPVKNSVESTNGCSNISKKKIKKPVVAVRSGQITDYFTVRRSNRIPTLCKMTERNQVIEDAILSGKEDGFKVIEFPDKGRGVVTTRAFKRGEFVLEYYGELINCDEAKRREGIYGDKENIGCYMYYFKCRNKQYCIDATKETGRLGRLVNHSKKGNLRTRTFLIQDSPHLILFASRDIEPGEELCYDYGDRRKAALESHPWLAS